MLTTILTACITAVITSVGTFLVQERRLRQEFEIDKQRVRTEFMAEQVAKDLLEADEWKKRSFEAIRGRIGGFGEDELRKILVRAGAVRFRGTDAQELWGLLRRNEEEL